MNIRIFLTLFLVSFGYGTTCFAYIPPYWMILSRTAERHGKGPYILEQEVQFTALPDTDRVLEKWTVLNEQSLRLDVVGLKNLKDKIRLTYVYQNGRRYFVDENGVKKSEKIPNEFSEHLFHFRNSKNVKPQLVQWGIAPSVSLKSEPYKYSEKKPLSEPEPYVRLSRWGGVINYAIGTPTPLSSSEDYPGLWIEQDQFLIRKARLAAKTEVEAELYKSFSGGLWYPNQRKIRWDNGEAKIQLSSLRAAPLTKDLKEKMESSGLNFGKSPELSRILPADEVVRDFYTRMR